MVGGQTSTPDGAAREFRHGSLSSWLMSLLGPVSRVTPVHTAMRNCTGDGPGITCAPFHELGSFI